jgi:hypothetical protein
MYASLSSKQFLIINQLNINQRWNQTFFINQYVPNEVLVVEILAHVTWSCNASTDTTFLTVEFITKICRSMDHSRK